MQLSRLREISKSDTPPTEVEEKKPLPLFEEEATLSDDEIALFGYVNLKNEDVKGLLPDMVKFLKMIPIHVAPGCRWIDGFSNAYDIETEEDYKRISWLIGQTYKMAYVFFQEKEKGKGFRVHYGRML